MYSRRVFKRVPVAPRVMGESARARPGPPKVDSVPWKGQTPHGWRLHGNQYVKPSSDREKAQQSLRSKMSRSLRPRPAVCPAGRTRGDARCAACFPPAASSLGQSEGLTQTARCQAEARSDTRAPLRGDAGSPTQVATRPHASGARARSGRSGQKHSLLRQGNLGLQEDTCFARF